MPEKKGEKSKLKKSLKKISKFELAYLGQKIENMKEQKKGVMLQLLNEKQIDS
jgi:hypothetical protein